MFDDDSLTLRVKVQKDVTVSIPYTDRRAYKHQDVPCVVAYYRRPTVAVSYNVDSMTDGRFVDRMRLAEVSYGT